LYPTRLIYLQTAARKRIAAKADVYEAVEKGDRNLVLGHLWADPDCVNRIRPRRFTALARVARVFL
jgi:hypothetical protein